MNTPAELKTDTKMDMLALAVARSHLEWQKVFTRKTEASLDFQQAPTTENSKAFEELVRTLQLATDVYSENQRELFAAAKERNPHLFPQQEGEGYTRDLEAEDRLRAMLNVHVAKIAHAHDVEVAGNNTYFALKASPAKT